MRTRVAMVVVFVVLSPKAAFGVTPGQQQEYEREFKELENRARSAHVDISTTRLREARNLSRQIERVQRSIQQLDQVRQFAVPQGFNAMAYEEKLAWFKVREQELAGRCDKLKQSYEFFITGTEKLQEMIQEIGDKIDAKDGRKIKTDEYYGVRKDELLRNAQFICSSHVQGIYRAEDEQLAKAVGNCLSKPEQLAFCYRNSRNNPAYVLRNAQELFEATNEKFAASCQAFVRRLSSNSDAAAREDAWSILIAEGLHKKTWVPAADVPGVTLGYDGERVIVRLDMNIWKGKDQILSLLPSEVAVRYRASTLALGSGVALVLSGDDHLTVYSGDGDDRKNVSVRRK